MRGADAIPGCVGRETGDVPHGRESHCRAPSCSHRRAHAIAPSHHRATSIGPAPTRLRHRADSIAPMPLCHCAIAPTESRPRHCDCHRGPGGSNIQIRAVRIWSARWPKRKRSRRFGRLIEPERGPETRTDACMICRGVGHVWEGYICSGLKSQGPPGEVGWNTEPGEGPETKTDACMICRGVGHVWEDVYL